MFVAGVCLITGAEKSLMQGVIAAALLCGSAWVFNKCDSMRSTKQNHVGYRKAA